MPAFTRLYLDTNILSASHWPRVSARLTRIVELARNFGVAVLIPQPVEDEREAQWIRELTKAFTGVKKATKELGKQLAAIDNQAQAPQALDLDELRQKYHVASLKARESLRISISPTTARTAAELFPFAIRHEAPFQEVHDCITGFQDAVILFSALDDAHQAGGAPCALFSEDGDFAKAHAAVAPIGVPFEHFRSYNTLWDAFADEIAPALSEWWEHDRQAARQSIEQNKAAIEAFIVSDVTTERLGPFVKQVQSARIEDISAAETPLPAFPNRPGPYARAAGSVVAITCTLRVSFSVRATVPRSLFDLLLRRSLNVPGETGEVQEEDPHDEMLLKSIEFECQGSFDGEDYALTNYKVVNLT